MQIEREKSIPRAEQEAAETLVALKENPVVFTEARQFFWPDLYPIYDEETDSVYYPLK